MSSSKHTCLNLAILSPSLFLLHHHIFFIFRNCIGQEFALNEEKVDLAHILRNFELSLDETKPPVEMDYRLILRPKHGLHLKLKPREIENL